jgi:hypothetical protein
LESPVGEPRSSLDGFRIRPATSSSSLFEEHTFSGTLGKSGSANIIGSESPGSEGEDEAEELDVEVKVAQRLERTASSSSKTGTGSRLREGADAKLKRVRDEGARLGKQAERDVGLRRQASSQSTHTFTSRPANTSVPSPSAGLQRTSSNDTAITTGGPSGASSTGPREAQPRSTSSHQPSSTHANSSSTSRKPRHLATPALPAAKVSPASSYSLYWSLTPIWGRLPPRGMRAHTATLIGTHIWVFGGCDQRGCFRDVWRLDVETFCWSKARVKGDIPPPCRAHSATLVKDRLFIFGGGEGPSYFNDTYVLDTGAYHDNVLGLDLGILTICSQSRLLGASRRCTVRFLHHGGRTPQCCAPEHLV